MDRLRAFWVASYVLAAGVALCVGGCRSPDAVLLRVSADARVEQYDLFVHDDESGQVIFHSGFNPVSPPGEAPRDLTTDKLKIALKLSRGGRFTLLLVGVTGEVVGGRPGPTATQLFWADHVGVSGSTEISARLLTVPSGDDADHDLWPDATDFVVHVPEAAMHYAAKSELLDCDDKIDRPTTSNGSEIPLRADQVHPFADELCGDGYDENCNGGEDEACQDQDHDHDFRGSDCDDKDPARHHPTDIDPFPDPPNCCGYNLGKAGTADEHKDFTGDPLLCPKRRCGDGIDESCRAAVNDPASDTRCVMDADCDGYPAAPDGDDCDDHDPAIHPGAVEICGNGISESCIKGEGGKVIPDNGCVPCDLDGDGYQRRDAPAGCPDAHDKHPGLVDCNDNDAGVFPGATMLCGGKEGGISAIGLVACALRSACRRVYESTGFGAGPGPGMTPKIASGSGAVGDMDCNGIAYEGCPSTDCDHDGDGEPGSGPGCLSATGNFDCDDEDPTIFHGAPDKCGNGVAENCTADTPCTSDADGDGYNAGVDCDDNNREIHPWATEVCNGVDDDCDGLIDEGNPDPTGKPLVEGGQITACTDDDDGECGKQKGRCICSVASESASYDPAHRTFCPGESAGQGKPPHCFGAGQPHPQSCDATSPKDDDCNGAVDDPAGANLAIKGMPCGVSVGQCKAGLIVGCNKSQTNPFVRFGRIDAKLAWIVCSSDAVYPEAEKCNGFDDDCDGTLNTAGGERDVDQDHYLGCSGCAGLSLAPPIEGCGDCADSDASVHPHAAELCDNKDNDCDSNTADGEDECTGGTSCCSVERACRNLSAGDVRNCGMCGRSCDPLKANACGPLAGAGGTCRCGTGAACGGSTYCSGSGCSACNTAQHCGPSCGACNSGQVCKADGSACTGCNGDADCASNKYCVGGSCAPRLARGVACMSDDQCLKAPDVASDLFCTDGVCCNEAPAQCGGCSACNVAGSVGTCMAVPSGQDPHNVCSASTLGCTAANCNGGGTCAAPDGTVCIAQACVGGAQTESTCQSGSCTALPTLSCAPYNCDASGAVCLTSCNADSDCAAHKWCKAGTPNTCVDQGASLGSCAPSDCVGPVLTCSQCVGDQACPSASMQCP